MEEEGKSRVGWNECRSAGKVGIRGRGSMDGGGGEGVEWRGGGRRGREEMWEVGGWRGMGVRRVEGAMEGGRNGGGE